VYEAWKNMLSQLMRGYQYFGFEAWTIPCLYVASKHLRVFAIKADAERGLNGNGSNLNDANATGASFDDFDPEAEKNQMLEDCARHLNKVFTLCISDR
jgi:hypothetical protein